MLIKEIVVGERRREDLGDVASLAKSIQKHGLLQPVVIDASMNLVAGERRLTACQSLGWDDIDVRQIGDLTTEELRLLELEENIRRKDLTEYEKNKAMVKYVDAVGEELEKEKDLLDSNKTTKVRVGRPTKGKASQQQVAQRTGLTQPTISQAQSHIAAVDKYPFMQPWPQYRVLEARELVATLPEDERERAVALIDQNGTRPDLGMGILRNIASKSLGERERIYQQNESMDPVQRQQALSAVVDKPLLDPRLSHLKQAMQALAALVRLSKDDLKSAFTTEIGHLILLEDEVKAAILKASLEEGQQSTENN